MSKQSFLLEAINNRTIHQRDKKNPWLPKIYDDVEEEDLLTDLIMCINLKSL